MMQDKRYIKQRLKKSGPACRTVSLSAVTTQNRAPCELMGAYIFPRMVGQSCNDVVALE